MIIIIIIDGNERIRESIGRESAFVCALVGRSALTESTMRLENIAHRQTRRVARVRLELLLYYNTTLRAYRHEKRATNRTRTRIIIF